MWQLGSAHERLKMGWMSIEKETEGGVVVVHARFGGAPPPPPPPLPAHPVSTPPIGRMAIVRGPGVRIVAPSWGPEPLAHGPPRGQARSDVEPGLSAPCRARPSARPGA